MRCVSGLWDEDGAAANPAGVEIGEGFRRGAQRVSPGVQGDLAGLRQHHELGELVVGPDDVADDVALGRDDVQGRDVQGAAVPDDEVRPCPATKSSTTSAPAPPVRSLTASTWPPSATTVCCAPSCSASLSASALRSTTMILVAVSAARHWTPMWPSPPAPMSTQVVPG